MRLALPALLVAGLLAGCASPPPPRPVAVAPAPAPAKESFVWARSDGQRMANNPALLRKGTRDKAECEAGATSGGQLNFTAFSACMNSRGYVRRDLPA